MPVRLPTRQPASPSFSFYETPTSEAKTIASWLGPAVSDAVVALIVFRAEGTRTGHGSGSMSACLCSCASVAATDL